MELWDAYLEDGSLAGRDLTRGQPVPKGLYHLVCCVLVRHADGTFLLMKRAAGKETWPGMYEASAGGSALKGETGEQAARRELYEETGIRAQRLTKLYARKGPHTLYEGFLCEVDGAKDEIVLQPGETEGYRWAARDELLQMLGIAPPVLIVQKGFWPYLGLDVAEAKEGSTTETM